LAYPKSSQIIREDEFDSKIAELSRMVTLNPDSADAFRSRGLLYGRKGEYALALSDLDRAIFLNPSDARAYGFRGLVRQKMGEIPLAIADLDNAIQLDPDNAKLYRAHRDHAASPQTNGNLALNNASAEVYEEGRFNLFLNPFVLLDVSPSATAQEIRHAYEDAMEDNVAPAGALLRAQQTLLTPRLRIDAEVGGLLDVGEQRSRQIIAALKTESKAANFDEIIHSLHALPRSNVLAHLGSKSPLDVDGLLQLLDAHATIAVGGVFDAVIEARELARMGRIDRIAVTEAVARLEQRQVKAVVDKLIGQSTFSITFTNFVRRVLSANDPLQVSKLDTFIKAYGLAAAPEFSRRREAVVSACDSLRGNPQDATLVDSISRRLHEWNEIGEPLQLFESHLHREDPAARELYLHVRELCLWLANEKQQYSIARRITQASADVFNELPRAIGQMEEDTGQLNELVSQQEASNLLDPLIKACENIKENHRAVERELLRSGFGPTSKGIAKDLYSRFKEAVERTKESKFADAPWQLVRSIAISLVNDSGSPKAATAIIEGLIDYSAANRPTTEMVEMLAQDKQVALKIVVQQDLEEALRGRRWKVALPLLDRLLTFETNGDESAALRTARKTITGKRRWQLIVRWGWAAAAVILLASVVASRDSPPTYSSAPQYSPQTQYSPSTQYSPAVPNSRPARTFSPNEATPNTSETPTFVRPPMGTDLLFTRANLRYCAFQNAMLEAARPLVNTETGVRALNAFIDDWNSRCSRYRYNESDKSAVDAEVADQAIKIESRGRAFASEWESAPTFSQSPLTVARLNGQQPLNFVVELARAPKEWRWGTSFRASMPATGGMLYIYPAAKIINSNHADGVLFP
jgi:hypothetical protein